MLSLFSKVYNHFMRDSLYRNSIYLFINTAVMAALGFFFWLINTRIFSTEEIGYGGVLISLITLITSFSLLGLNASLVKFLPTTKSYSVKINTVFLVVSIAAIVASLLYITGVQWFSPTLTLLKDPLIAMFFIFGMVVMTLFICIESVFLAFRSAKYILVKGTIFSVAKLILPFMLISWGAIGIFASWILAAFVSLLVAMIILIVKFKHRYKFEYDPIVMKKMFSFSSTNYAVWFIDSLPIAILPVFVASSLGVESAAHYFISMQIVIVLYTIAHITSSSLFAEGSSDDTNIKPLVIKAFLISGVALIPALVVCLFFAGEILSIFGSQYSEGALEFFKIASVSSVFVVINYLLMAILRIRSKLKALFWLTTIGTAVILSLSFLLSKGGLIGIGYGLLFGAATMSALSGLYVFIKRKELGM